MNHVHGQASGLNAITQAYATNQAKSPPQYLMVHQQAKPQTPLHPRKSAAQLQQKQVALTHVKSHPVFFSPLRPKQYPQAQQTHTPIVLKNGDKIQQPHHKRQSQIAGQQLKHIMLRLRDYRQKNRELRLGSIDIITDARIQAKQSIQLVQKQYSQEIAKLLDKNKVHENESLELKQEIKNLHNTIQSMQQNINDMQQQLIDNQQNQHEEHSTVNNNLNDEIDRLNDEIAEYEADQQDLKHQINELNTKLQNEKSLRFEIQSKKEELDKYYTMAYEQVQTNAEQERVYLQHISDLQNEIQQHDQGMTMIQQDNEILRSENARLLELIQELQNQQNSYKSLDEDRTNIQFEQRPQNYMLVQDEQLEACPEPELQEPQYTSEVQHSDLENQISVLQKQITYYEAELLVKNKVTKQMQEMLSNLEKDRIAYKVQIQLLQESLDAEKKDCQKHRGDLKLTIQELEQQLQVEVQKNQNYEADQKQLQQQLKVYSNKQNLNDDQIQYLNSELTNKNNKIEEQANQMTSLQKTIDQLNDQRTISDKDKTSTIHDLEKQLQDTIQKHKDQELIHTQLQQALNQSSHEAELQISNLIQELTNKNTILQNRANQISTLQNTIDELHVKRTKSDKQYENLIEELEKQLQDEVQKNQNHNHNQVQIEQQQGQDSNKSNQIQILKTELANKSQILKDLNQQISTQQKIIDDLQDQMAESDQNAQLQIQELEKLLLNEVEKYHNQNQAQQLKEDSVKQSEINSQLQEFNLKLNDNNKLLEDYHQQINNLQKQLNDQKTQSDEEFKRQLEESTKSISRLQNTIAQLNDQIIQSAEKYQGEIQELETQLEDEIQKHQSNEFKQCLLQQGSDKLNDLKIQIQSLSLELTNNNTIIQEQNKEISTLQGTITDLKDESTQIEKISRLKIQKLESQLAEEIQNCQTQEANKEQLLQKLKAETDKQNQLDQKVQELNTELKYKNKILEDHNKQTSALQKNIDELNDKSTRSDENFKLNINQLEDQLQAINTKNLLLKEQIENEVCKHIQLNETLLFQNSQLADLKNQFQVVLSQNMQLQWEMAGQSQDNEANTTIDDLKKQQVQQLQLLNSDLEQKLLERQLKFASQGEDYEKVLNQVQIEIDKQKDQISLLQDMIHELGEENRALKFTLKSQKQTNGVQSPIEEILIDQHTILQEEYQQKEQDILDLHLQLESKEEIIHSLEVHISKLMDESLQLKQQINDQTQLLNDKSSAIDQFTSNNPKENQAHQVIINQLQQHSKILEDQLKEQLEDQLTLSPSPKQQMIELQSEQKEDLVIQFSASEFINKNSQQLIEDKSPEILNLQSQLLENQKLTSKQNEQVQFMMKQRDQFEKDILQLQDRINQLTDLNIQLEAQNTYQQISKIMSETTIPEISQDEHSKSESQDQQLLQAQMIKQLESQILKTIEELTEQTQKIQYLEALIQEQQSEIEELQARPKRHLTFNLEDVKQSPMRKEDLRANVYTPLSISSVKSEQFPKSKEERQKLMKNVMRSAQLSASMMAAKGDYTTLQQVVQQHDSSSSRGNSSRDLSQSYPPPKQ